MLDRLVFVRSAAKPADFPKDKRPHVVFVGRSNVGKSSTINCLSGKRDAARVSSKPGKTVFVNLYDVGEGWLVDLPGYGYSKTGKAERERYSRLIDEYLEQALRDISLVCHIVDARHEPTADDKTMASWLKQTGVRFAVIANKTDKIAKIKIPEHLDMIRAELGLEESIPVLPLSAEKGDGKQEIIGRIETAYREAHN